MKKFLSLLLVLVIGLSLISCKKEEKYQPLFTEGLYDCVDNYNQIICYYGFYNTTGDNNGYGGTMYNKDGNGVPFRYEVKKNKSLDQVTFHVGDESETEVGYVVKTSETDYVILYESGKQVMLRFISPDIDYIDKILATENN